MAVQKHKVTRSRRGMRRSHDALKRPNLTEDILTGEKHRRHHIAQDGTYRGRLLIQPRVKQNQDEEQEET
ncbi:MAG: 50S ribosomal protein L32 [Gammaproteobacteria bacterium]